MTKVISIVGTRPQFLKLAPLSQELSSHPEINHLIVHTGQHYDQNMSGDLFQTLKVPKPDYHLSRSGQTNTQMISHLLVELEKILLEERPRAVLVYGDCDTTLAGALATKNLKVEPKPLLFHVESGMRSYNLGMPEERNRVMVDHISDYLLCSTQDSVTKLKEEQISHQVHYIGNLQLDLLRNILPLTEENSEFTSIENQYILLTIHREYNTNHQNLFAIFQELDQFCRRNGKTVIFPIHPRTRKVLEKDLRKIPEVIKLIDPVDYVRMVDLLRNCYLVITDSGGIQPEAWLLCKKCLIFRRETEWIEPLKNHNSVLYNPSISLEQNLSYFLETPITPRVDPEELPWASKEIAKILLNL